MRGGAALFADFRERIDDYREARDFPAVKGPSYLSVHLRFGTVSVRELAGVRARMLAASRAAPARRPGCRNSSGASSTRRSSGITRTSSTGAFKPEYDALRFPDDPARSPRGARAAPATRSSTRRCGSSTPPATCTTGCGWSRRRSWSRTCSSTGGWGERYFADTLIDFDLASNNGGWQWAASTGCDAQPYFRIFNPVTQSERFDPDGEFIRRYVPEVAALSAKEIHAPWLVPPAPSRRSGVVVGRDYPAPIVDHAGARARAALGAASASHALPTGPVPRRARPARHTG